MGQKGDKRVKRKRVTQKDDEARRQALRYNLRETISMISKADADILERRQVEEDPFINYYQKYDLLTPYYDFESLYTIYEESDVLQACVEAMQMNVDGFGYDLQFLGDDIKQKGTPVAQTQFTKATNFFNQANENESFATVRKKMREDFEVLGNGALEVIRNRAGNIQLIYYMPMKYLRISKLEGRKTKVPVTIMRDGVPTKLQLFKHFRRFCQIDQTGRRKKWFKSFGDPRPLDANTGEFKNVKNAASEILFFRSSMGGSVYGLPRWIGAVLEAMGRRSAQYVNYDLFESQGIPPMALLVSNGVLTDESVLELEKLVRSMRGVEQWNRIALFESTVESLGLEEKGGAKLELKNMADYRKDDMMFNTYLKNTEQNIRHRFRLSPLYVGGTETYTLATAKAARTIAEEQVFVPEREEFDEIVNNLILVPELDVKLWKYVTRGPTIAAPEEVSKGLKDFSSMGAVSVNHAIEAANKVFNLSMSKYDKPWGDYPLVFISKLVEQGHPIEGLEELTGITPSPQQLKLPGAGKPASPIPPAAQKILKSDLFDEEDKRLYRKLLLIEDAVERAELDEETTL